MEGFLKKNIKKGINFSDNKTSKTLHFRGVSRNGSFDD